MNRENYRKLLLVQIGGDLRYIVNEQLVVKVCGDYAKNYRGTMQDTEWGVVGADLLRITQHNNLSESGHAYDFSGSLGWQIPIFPNWLTLVAEAGYAQNVQYLKTYRSFLTIDLINDENGRIPGRRSRTHLTWTGPWAGGEIALRFCSLKITAACEYHWAHFKGRGTQHLGGNCRNNCTVNFQQKAGAYGVVGRATISQTFFTRWTFGLSGVLQYWKTRPGTITYTNPPPNTKRHLNRSKWNSSSLTATLSYRF